MTHRKLCVRVSLMVLFAAAVALAFAGCSVGGVKVDIEGVEFTMEENQAVIENTELGVKLEVDLAAHVRLRRPSLRTKHQNGWRR